jgi:hypothetical protein
VSLKFTEGFIKRYLRVPPITEEEQDGRMYREVQWLGDVPHQNIASDLRAKLVAQKFRNRKRRKRESKKEVLLRREKNTEWEAQHIDDGGIRQKKKL